MNTTQSLTELFGEVIFTYTRAQAIADGLLIDVTDTAREAGFMWPVALTAGVWNDCVAWSETDRQRQVHQDQSGRLYDVLWMGIYAIRSARSSGNELLYELYRVPPDGQSTDAQLTRLKLNVGPGDTGEPVVTIMLPEED